MGQSPQHNPKMTKLYYTPTSCGAASFIAAVAGGVKIEAEQVDIKTHVTSSGADYYAINSKGNVPALVLDDGTVLNEGAAVLQYIADQAPGKIAGEYGSSERYLVQNILNYLASEVHASYGPLFYGLEGDAKEAQLKKISSKLEYIAKNVLKGNYLVGEKFTIADSYFYIILSWSGYVGVDVAAHPTIKAYQEFIGALPFVVEAHAAMATNPSST
eukprot:GDKK01044614.1.p2 GENE.GDKK01044614.1~~GDKK01044614.1.p2  ORF type:complete len:215 (+),score=70.88 GDKK01044614.1:1-645(+)